MPLSDETLRSILAHAGGCEFDALTDEAEVVAMATDLLAARARIAELEARRDARAALADRAREQERRMEAEAERDRCKALALKSVAAEIVEFIECVEEFGLDAIDADLVDRLRAAITSSTKEA